MIEALDCTASAPAYLTLELLAQLHPHFTARQLTSWTTYRLLPPVKRRVPPGATDGIARKRYPWWTPHLLAELLREQQAGATIRELQQGSAARLARWSGAPCTSPPVPPPPTPPVDMRTRRAVWGYATRLPHPPDDDDEYVVIVVYAADGTKTTIPVLRPTAREDGP